MDNTLQNSHVSQWAEPAVIELPRIYDPRGNLTFLQNGDGLFPFTIARVYWIYDVPAGEQRGSHAHHFGKELLIAAAGSFAVNLFDGKKWQKFTLNRPYQGLYVPPGYWRTLDDFSSGSVCMVLTSTLYNEEDYIRDYDEFIQSRS